MNLATHQRSLIVQRIIQSGLVAIIRADDRDVGLKTAEACHRGGVVCLEVSFTTPGAIDLIKDLSARFAKEGMLVGAGTVLDPETARLAILAGARFIVSPYLNTETIRLCNRYQIPTLPGALSVKEVVEALEAGADIVKVFPGETMGIDFIKAVRAPLPQAPLMPTGGVSLENVAEWFKNGCIAVGVGGSLTSGSKRGDFDAVTATAKGFIAKINAARS